MPLNKPRIISICKTVSRNLWDIHEQRVQLILPQRNQKETDKFSEQEARFLFAAELCKHKDLFYSVETPTEGQYQFNGKQNERRALTDMTLYESKSGKPEEEDPKYNIEFKANSQKDSINKDIEKLIKETPPGLWFHVFDNINSKTLPNVFNEISEAIREHSKWLNKKNKAILFWFCVRQQKLACFKEITEKEIKEANKSKLFLGLEYKDGEVAIKDSCQNGWEIFKLQRE